MNIKTTHLLFSSLFTVTLMSLPALSAPITPEASLERLNPGSVKRLVGNMSQAELVMTSKTSTGEPAAYIFRSGNTKEGFMILSADDAAYPVLGYSDSGSFDPSNIPPQMEWWLSQYASQIEKARLLNLPGKEENTSLLTDDGKEAIEPMVKTKWNQDEPYNLMCPTDPRGTYCYTGCVATAMAQVMKYFEYPETGNGFISYSFTLNNTPIQLMMDLSDTPFDWKNMLDTYGRGNYSKEEGNAVAYLMKACGYSVEMNYGTDASGAIGNLISGALSTYFGYDKSARYVSRLPYSDAQWSDLIYENLRNVGPVIYNGTSAMQGGHSFVCDGYDGNGFFHFNWGWGGISDGYFALEALNPQSIGIGGYAGGFNLSQEVVIGICKPDGEDHSLPANIIQQGSSYALLENSSLNFYADNYPSPGVINLGGSRVTMEFGATFSQIDNPENEILTLGKFGTDIALTLDMRQSVEYSSFRHPEVKIPSDLEDGTYKVTLMTRDSKFRNAPWQPIQVTYGDYNYVLLTVADGEYEVTAPEPVTVSVTSASFVGDVVYGSTARLKTTIVNNSDIEVTRPFWALFELMDDAVLYSSARMVTLQPGENAGLEWDVDIYRLAYWFAVDKPSTLNLYIADPSTGEVYGNFGTVTMLPPLGGGVKINVDEFTIENVETFVENIPGEGTVTVYRIGDPEKFNAVVGVTPKNNYFDGYLVLTAEGVGDASLSTGVAEIYRTKVFIVKDTPYYSQPNLSYSQSEPGEVYKLTLHGESGGTTIKLATLYFTYGDSGIEAPEDRDAAPEYFNLQGMRINAPIPGKPLIVKESDKVRKVILYN